MLDGRLCSSAKVDALGVVQRLELLDTFARVVQKPSDAAVM